MKCPVCGAAELVHDVRDVPYTYKGQTTVLPHVEADYCDACGDHLTGPAEGKRTMDLMGAFIKQVNEQQADPNFIRSVRAKLNLTQREAGDLFGGGVNAFSRYESGKVEPPKSLSILFALLDENPALLQRIRQAG